MQQTITVDRGYVLKNPVNGEALVLEVTTLCKNGLGEPVGQNMIK